VPAFPALERHPLDLDRLAEDVRPKECSDMCAPAATGDTRFPRGIKRKEVYSVQEVLPHELQGRLRLREQLSQACAVVQSHRDSNH
jgi:hypothetical protein